MTRDEFVYEALLFGCRDLDLEPPNIEIIHGSIFGNNDIAAAINLKYYTIYLQEVWYENTKLYSLAYAVFYQLRKIYQFQLKIEVNTWNKNIKKWRKEVNLYIEPDKKSVPQLMITNPLEDAKRYAVETIKIFIKSLENSNFT